MRKLLSISLLIVLTALAAGIFAAPRSQRPVDQLRQKARYYYLEGLRHQTEGNDDRA